MATTASVNPPGVVSRAIPSRLWLGLAFFAIYVVWGTTYLAIRYAVETIPPLVTAGVRHTAAGLILLGIAWSRGFRPRREHWIAGAALGALFFLVGHAACTGPSSMFLPDWLHSWWQANRCGSCC